MAKRVDMDGSGRIVPIYIVGSEGDGSESRNVWKWEYIVPVQEEVKEMVERVDMDESGSIEFLYRRK